MYIPIIRTKPFPIRLCIQMRMKPTIMTKIAVSHEFTAMPNKYILKYRKSKGVTIHTSGITYSKTAHIRLIIPIKNFCMSQKIALQLLLLRIVSLALIHLSPSSFFLVRIILSIHLYKPLFEYVHTEQTCELFVAPKPTREYPKR